MLLYYPSNYEINVLKIANNLKKSNTVLLLPKINNGNLLKFIKWNEKDILLANNLVYPNQSNRTKITYPMLYLSFISF